LLLAFPRPIERTRWNVINNGETVIDLRLVCPYADDYARSSPIEPSVAGGGKIARAVARLVTGYDFQGAGSRVFT
jgi:hypothetical protein